MSLGDTRASPSTQPADEALSAIVSDSLIFQSVMRLSISSIAGANAVGGGQHVVLGAALPRQVVAEDEADLDLDPRVAVPARGHRAVLEDLHVVEQVAVVGLVDAHHLLHRLATTARPCGR